MNGSEDFMIIACDGLWDTVTPMSATICVYNQLQTDQGKCLEKNNLSVFRYSVDLYHPGFKHSFESICI